MEVLQEEQLDKENIEFNYAAEFVKDSNANIYLTGKAGTGKTTFLKYVKSLIDKNTVIVAPTGVAAINAGGTTIHSFFQIPFSPFLPHDKRLRTKIPKGDDEDVSIYNTFRYRDDKRKIIENLDLLIIDEVSMVRCDILDVIDKILRTFRKQWYAPFGGVQVILIGNLYQLPPIAKPDEWNILKRSYKTEFFFSAHCIEQNIPLFIELKKIYRQKEQSFIDLLNKVRISDVSDSDIQALNRKYNPKFKPPETENYIILATHNYQVDNVNSEKLKELSTPLKVYQGTVTGKFPKNWKGEYILPTDKDLMLKEGAQIMFLKNDSGEDKIFYNGKIAKIKILEEDEIKVELPNKEIINLEKHTWENVKYVWDEEEKKVKSEVIGTFTQYPIRLAWAITVHKSQGLTFEQVYADLGSSFAAGQVYVALSRCTSSNGLILKSRLRKEIIKTDPRVIEFSKNETGREDLISELNKIKATKYFNSFKYNLSIREYDSAINSLLIALKLSDKLDSEETRRYLKVYFQKIAHYQEMNLKMRNSITSIINKVVVLKQENKKISSSMNGYKGRTTSLSNEVKKLKVEIERLKKITWWQKLFGKK